MKTMLEYEIRNNIQPKLDSSENISMSTADLKEMIVASDYIKRRIKELETKIKKVA
jgi:hypothetical protein